MIMNKYINNKNLFLAATILLFVVIRYANVAAFNETKFAQFSPIFAIGLFTGAIVQDWKKSLLITFIAMLASDLLVQNVYYAGQYGVMYSGWYLNYPLYLGFVLAGHYFIKKINVTNVLFTALGTAVAYFVLSNFITWLGGITDLRTDHTTRLALNTDGFVQCYNQAIPFFKSSLDATIAYSVLFFGLYQVLVNTKKLAVSKA